MSAEAPTTAVPLFEFAQPLLTELSATGITGAAGGTTPEVSSTTAAVPPSDIIPQTASPSASMTRVAGASSSGGFNPSSISGMSRKPSERSLFISGLHPDAEFTHLHELFEKYGKLISCRVLKDAKTGASRCIGYVNFQEPADAQRALDGEHGKPGPAGGGPLSIRFAEDDPGFIPEETRKLFIRYVPLDTTVDELRRVYDRYGTITECTIMPDTSSAGRQEQEMWNMAYVTFSTSEQATSACAKTHRTFALGSRHEVHVKPAETLATRALRQRKHESMDSKTTAGSMSSHTAGGGSRSSTQHTQPTVIMQPMAYPMMMHPPGAPTMMPQGIPMASPGYHTVLMPVANGGMAPVMVPDGSYAPLQTMPMMMAAPQWVPAGPAPFMMVPQPMAPFMTIPQGFAGSHHHPQ